jgi:hypothetical protein
MISQKLKKKRTRDPICSFLRKLISPYGFGWAEQGGVGRYSNDQLIRWYNAHGFMGSPSNGDLYTHFAGQTTLYFWADGRKGTPQTLSMVDIDCHERGNPKSAKAFADWLTQNGFPNLFHEPSTHGKGRHGYFVLYKEGFGDIAVSDILGRLDKTLKKLLRVFLATHPGHQIENVEIKGTPHVITWAKGEGRRIETMKSGDLAKLPRDILDRFDEFKNTTVLSFGDISDLEEKVERIVIPGPEKLSVSKVKGSTPNHPIPKDEVEGMGGPYLDFARSWINEPIATSSRARVEAEDLAIGLGIVKVCTSKPNADGTMPTQRIKAIWDKLFENGEVDRAFDYHRWRVVRNLIESKRGLEMVDRRFYTGFANDQGQEIKGRAARWHMASWLIEKLDEAVIAGCRIVDSGYKTSNSGCMSSDLRCKIDALGHKFSDSESMSKDSKYKSSDLSSCQDQGEALLEQETKKVLKLESNNNQGGALLEQETEEVLETSPHDNQGPPPLEQVEEQDDDDLFDKDWILDFRRSMPPVIGLIWGGSIHNMPREAA